MTYARRLAATAILVASSACSREEREPASTPPRAALPAAASGTVARSAASAEARRSGVPSFDDYEGPYCELVCWNSPLTADVAEARASEAGLRCSNRQCCSWLCY